MLMKNEPKKTRNTLKKHVRSAAVTVTAAASLAVGSLVDSPDALLDPAFETASRSDTAIVSVGKRVSSRPTAARLPFADRARAWLIRLPLAVRALVLLPLWLVGTVLIAMLSAASQVLAPFLPVLLRVLLNAALLFAFVALVYSFLFPKKKVRDLFYKKNLIPLLLAVGIVTVADALLPVLVENGKAVRMLIRAAVGFAALLIVCGRILIGHRAKRSEVCV